MASDARRARLRRRVAEWTTRLQVQPKVVHVRKMKRKWGSCSTGGVVTLAADLVRKPTGFQDFVIAHELLHLRVRNHGKLFRALLAVHIPGWRRHDIARRQGASKLN